MKNLLFFFISLCLAGSTFAQSNADKKTEKLYHLAETNFNRFASKIAGKSSSDFERTQHIVTWFAQNFDWKSTDYRKRTAQEIIQRRGGNCNELAIVSIECMKALGIQYRRVREINLHVDTPRRQETAVQKVQESGNRMSVFGQWHNDHVWIEVYDPETGRWFPADPSIGVVGEAQWMAARFGFGERFTLDPSSRDMIAPFAVFAIDDKGNLLENRSRHYAIDEFNQLYDEKLQTLPSWNKWVHGVEALSDKARGAFEGTINLHDYTEEIHELWDIYYQLKMEYNDLK